MTNNNIKTKIINLAIISLIAVEPLNFLFLQFLYFEADSALLLVTSALTILNSSFSITTSILRNFESLLLPHFATIVLLLLCLFQYRHLLQVRHSLQGN
jgi:hypothetical protein